MAFGRIVVVGARGMLGQAVMADLTGKGYDVVGLGSDQCNLLHDADAIYRTLALLEPALVLQTAAYTNVDGAEREPELAMAINKDGTQKLAEVTAQLDAIFAYVSTDYVFDGHTDRPYRPEDKPNPINTYGRSKLYGEVWAKESSDTHYVLRTSWLYGRHRKNFVSMILDSAREGRPMTIVTDWVGSPSWTGNVAHAIERVITSGAYGTYHVADQGAVSKYDQAVAICRAAGLPSDHLKPVSYKDLNFSAQRPAYSPLDSGELSMPSWETGLHGYLAELAAVTGGV
ncbi:MAG: dTDP-4-dehydrorhamnose reductase [Vampirovibrionales bacterium]